MATPINEIINKFVAGTEASGFGNGHINETYLIEPRQYIIQKINTKVFTKPDELMSNIVNVTTFLQKKIKEEYGDPTRETLTVVKTIDGKDYYQDEDGGCYRVYKYIDNSRAVDFNPTLSELYNAAKAFGKFQKMLDDYPADTLYETIVNFHYTPGRFNNLLKAIEEDAVGRKASVEKEIEFALSCRDWISTVTDGIADGTIPLRVTHNDTKINNVLFELNSDKAFCVVDLDTVMPGSVLYDFGDALRIGAATADEDETDLSKVSFDIEKFRSFTKGFLKEVAVCLTDREIELLAFSAKLLTYECGIRFLTDYLQGDTYFRIHRENHNLDRARTQFKLVWDMDQKMDEMNAIVHDIAKKYRR